MTDLTTAPGGAVPAWDGPTADYRTKSLRRRQTVATEAPAPLPHPARFMALTRLSSDTESNVGNDAEQLRRLERDVAREGGVIVAHHSERGVSAFDQDEPWPGYLAAWEAVEAGAVDGICAVEKDRFIRDTVESALFDRHCVRHGVRRLMFAGKVFDPASPDDRMTGTILAAVAERESAVKRYRATRKAAQNAREGKPQPGRRPYGYKKGALEIEPSEAAVIRELMSRALAGAPIGALARELNQKGIKTASGANWTPGGVRQILWSWRIAGIRSHHDVPISEGQWPAIVERWEVEAFRQMRGTSKYSQKSGVRKGRPKALLAGMIECGCHGYTAVVHGGDYWVRSPLGTKDCSMFVRKDKLDAFVTEAFLAAIRDGRYLDDASKETATALAAIESELTQVRERRDKLADSFADGAISNAAFERAEWRLTEKEHDLTTRAAELNLSPSLRGLEGIEQDWSRLTDTERRKALSVVIEKVILEPHPARTLDIGAYARIVFKA